MSGKAGRSGRISRAEEEQTAKAAKSALIAKYGDLETALIKAVDDPILKKFVYEHAFGKPTEKIDHDGSVTQELVFKVVRANNKD